MKKVSSWLWGGVLVILGVVLGINALGLVHINIFFPGWWTLFIIVPSLVGIFTEEHKGGSFVGLAIGVCLLLSCWGILPLAVLWKLVLPVILVVMGVGVIMRGTARGEVIDKIREAEREQSGGHRYRDVKEAEVVDDDEDSDDEDDDDDRGNDNSGEEPQRKEYWSTFGTQDINYTGKEFAGCKVDAVFGGADVDLRHAKIRDKAVLKTSSFFGGIIVYAPDDVKIEVASTAIFGGVSDKRKKIPIAGVEKTLFIEATCVFGGVEIR